MFEFLEYVQKKNSTFFYTITFLKSEYIVSAVIDARKFGGKYSTIAEVESMFREELATVTENLEPPPLRLISDVKKGKLDI